MSTKSAQLNIFCTRAESRGGPVAVTDLTGSKLRPAIVIHESEQDVIVAFISSRIPVPLQESDLLITTDHPAFRSTGLKISSVIKFDKIATLSKTLVEGETGES